MRKIYRFCFIFVLFGLTGCVTGWPDDLNGTSFEPVNKVAQEQGDNK